MNILSSIVRENRFRPEDVPRFESKLFYEGDRHRPYVERFSALLFFATVIATAGVLADSTATVIGAMIVAPLMTPIMATSAALVMGNMQRALRSLLLVTIGVVGVITLAWLIGSLYSGAIDFGENSQITARVSPRLIDLVAALASGAAGAFCMSREDIADSLPGVAIAISLVPPLCVVGISLSAGNLDSASGAFLLFVTNFLSILLAGGAVLGILGLNGAAMVEIRGPARRNAFVLIAVAALLVAVPLTITGQRVTREALTEIASRQAAEAWVAGTEFDVRIVRAIGDNVAITVSGYEEPPPFEDLVTAVHDSVGRPVVVNLEIIPALEINSAEESP